MLLTFSCVVPALIGLFYYNWIDKTMHPFIWTICLSVITEVTEKIVITHNGPWLVYYLVGNFYYVFNVFLYLLFFVRLKIISSTFFYVCFAICLSAFLINSFFQMPFQKLLLSATFVYDSIILALAVNVLSQQVFRLDIHVSKNPLFIISATVVIYSAISLLVNIIYVLQGKTGFNSFIFSIHRYIDGISYYIFAAALFHMRGRRGSDPSQNVKFAEPLVAQ